MGSRPVERALTTRVPPRINADLRRRIDIATRGSAPFHSRKCQTPGTEAWTLVLDYTVGVWPLGQRHFSSSNCFG